MRNFSMLVLGLTLFFVLLPSAHTRPAIDKGSKPKPAKPLANIETLRSDDSAVQSDGTGKGAVLCLWGIYQAVRAVGMECHKGEDREFQIALKQSLDDIDKFIINNSKRPVTRANLEARRLQGLEQLRASGNICTGDAVKLYSAFRTNGATALRAQTRDLLSIPREPVMNPCL